MFRITEQPTPAQLQAFHKRLMYRGRQPTRQELADSIGMSLGTFEGYYYERRIGRRPRPLMPAPAWTLLRITWDALLHAQWQQMRPKHEGQ